MVKIKITDAMIQVIEENEHKRSPEKITPELMAEKLSKIMGEPVSVQRVGSVIGNIRRNRPGGKSIELFEGTYRLVEAPEAEEANPDDDYTYVRIYKLLSRGLELFNSRDIAEWLNITEPQARTGVAAINRLSNSGLKLGGQRMKNVAHDEYGKYIFVEPKEPQKKDPVPKRTADLEGLDAEAILAFRNVSEVILRRGRTTLKTPMLGEAFGFSRGPKGRTKGFLMIQEDVTKIIIIWSVGGEQFEEEFFIPDTWAAYFYPLN